MIENKAAVLFDGLTIVGIILILILGVSLLLGWYYDVYAQYDEPSSNWGEIDKSTTNNDYTFPNATIIILDDDYKEILENLGIAIKNKTTEKKSGDGINGTSGS